MQINPQKILDRKILIPSEYSQCQQVGIDLSISQDVEIEHGHAVNILFNEKVKLPKDIFMTFTQRSSFSRRGIFVTSGVYDPGFEGLCGCTIYNLSGETCTIEKNTRIGQSLFFEADSASEYQGQWQGWDNK